MVSSLVVMAASLVGVRDACASKKGKEQNEEGEEEERGHEEAGREEQKAAQGSDDAEGGPQGKQDWRAKERQGRVGRGKRGSKMMEGDAKREKPSDSGRTMKDNLDNIPLCTNIPTPP